MSGPEVEFTIIVYGSFPDDPSDFGKRFCGDDQRRVEIKLVTRAPTAGLLQQPQEAQKWAQSVSMKVGMDLKHSQQWHCEFCNKLARESDFQMMSWLHITPPKCNVYVNLLCDAGYGPCSEKLREASSEISVMTGRPMQSRMPPSQPNQFPAAASCAKCKREETIHQAMSRCSRCKLIRYCSVDCQKADWSRHKECCKLVKEVKWFGK